MFSTSPSERYSIDTGKTTQFSDAWVLLALLLGITGLILQNVFLTTGAATMLTVAAISWLWNRYSLRHVHYRRRLSETRAFPGEVLTLVLEVSNSKPIPLTWLVVRDIFPAGLPVDGRDLPVNPSSNLVDFTTFWMPGANQKISRTFSITCRERGYFRFGPAAIESGDGFGFFESRATLQRSPAKQIDELAAGDRLIVYPRIYTVEELRLPARNPFGESLSRQTLYEDPLRTAGVREWQQYDDVRRIHWLASARSQEMLSRVYEPSEEQQTVIFLNVATLERHWQGVVPELLERAVSVAGSIAALTLQQRQPTGIIANGSIPGSDQEIRLLPGRSPSQLMHILELLAGVTAWAAPTCCRPRCRSSSTPRSGPGSVASRCARTPSARRSRPGGPRPRCSAVSPTPASPSP